MVSISLTGKCKKCGAATDSSFYIDSEKWDNMTMEEKTDYISKSGNVGKNEETEEMPETWEPFITTCPSFDGKHIDQYLGTVYGTHVYWMSTGWFSGGFSNQDSPLEGKHFNNQEDLFGAAFSSAKRKMYDKAIALGGNAVVSMQTGITSLSNSNFVIVVVSGTAVRTSE